MPDSFILVDEEPDKRMISHADSRDSWRKGIVAIIGLADEEERNELRDEPWMSVGSEKGINLGGAVLDRWEMSGTTPEQDPVAVQFIVCAAHGPNESAPQMTVALGTIDRTDPEALGILRAMDASLTFNGLPVSPARSAEVEGAPATGEASETTSGARMFGVDLDVIE